MHLVGDPLFKKHLSAFTEGSIEAFHLSRWEIWVDRPGDVFQNLFMITGFLSLFAILPALPMKVEDVEEAEGFV